MATGDRDALAEALADDALIEGVGAAIWQANSELTKPEYRNMPDAEARTYFAHAAIDAILASDWLAQRDLRVRAEALREAADSSTEDGGAWDVLALYVSEAGHPYALEGIRRWLRERADRIEAGG